MNVSGWANLFIAFVELDLDWDDALFCEVVTVPPFQVTNPLLITVSPENIICIQYSYECLNLKSLYFYILRLFSVGGVVRKTCAQLYLSGHTTIRAALVKTIK